MTPAQQAAARRGLAGSTKTSTVSKRKSRAAADMRADWKPGIAKATDGTTGSNACLCGCGTKVKGKFAQGHDARVHSWLLAVEREERTRASLPEITQAAVKAGVLVVHAANPQDGTVLSEEARRRVVATPRPAAKTTSKGKGKGKATKRRGAVRLPIQHSVAA